MARVKIDYGIDLGTTNSAIARIELGEPIIKKDPETGMDTVPSCVSLKKRGVIDVGNKALKQIGVDKRAQIKNENYTSNVFIEFKRTMGTDKLYFSSNHEKEFTSEDLSSEVLKKLKQNIDDETLRSVVITVPAKFGANQKEATKRAAALAGFEQCELLSEPVAAAYAYSLKSKIKDGYWIVFDFGGGTFDAALLKIKDGVFTVENTEGDIYLGGKNIDYAIVDEIIIPYLKDNFSIDEMLADENRKESLRNVLKIDAEQKKIELSKKDVDKVLIFDEFAEYGIDDEGNDISIELEITKEQLNQVQKKYFQRAVDKTKELLKNANIDANKIDALVLVGGPTKTPLLREMLENQVTKKVDFSLDPMTVVAKGASIFASTINNEIISDPPDKKYVVDVELNYNTPVTDTEVKISLKCKNYPTFEKEKLFFAIFRSDEAWSSGKIELTSKIKILDVFLTEYVPNSFIIKMFDGKGDPVEVSTNSFTILHGIGDGGGGGVNLPYYYGIEVLDEDLERMVFVPLRGLDKNKLTPATGISNGLRTSSQIRPGNKSDFLRIPLYQGDNNAEGSRAIYNEHVYDIDISGEDLPALLPANSTFDLTVSVDRNEGITVKAYFHALDFQHEMKIDKDHRQSIPDSDKIESEFRNGFNIIREIKQSGVLQDDAKINELEKELKDLREYFEKGKGDEDRRKETFDKMRVILIKVDEVSQGTEWDRIEKEIRTEFDRLERVNNDFGNENTNESVNKLRQRTDEIIRSKDPSLGKDVLKEINTLIIMITLIYQLINSIRRWNENFDLINWKNKDRVRQLVNQGLSIIATNPTEETLLPICVEVENNYPDEMCPHCGKKQSQCVCVKR
jgi:molecular chaperone DnaK